VFGKNRETVKGGREKKRILGRRGAEKTQGSIRGVLEYQSNNEGRVLGPRNIEKLDVRGCLGRGAESGKEKRHS